MGDGDWMFPALLITAMLLALALTYLQTRAYNNQLNAALKVVDGEHLMLVSGRGRSFQGGAIVVAIVDTEGREIVWARAMKGRSVFARFREAPALLGPMEGAADRVKGKQFQAAVTMAMEQVRPAVTDDITVPNLTPSRVVTRRTHPTSRTTRRASTARVSST